MKIMAKEENWQLSVEMRSEAIHQKISQKKNGSTGNAILTRNSEYYLLQVVFHHFAIDSLHFGLSTSIPH